MEKVPWIRTPPHIWSTNLRNFARRTLKHRRSSPTAGCSQATARYRHRRQTKACRRSQIASIHRKEYSRIRQQAEKSESALEIARKQTEQLQADLLQRDDIIRNLNDRLADALREADRLASRDANDMSHLELTEIPDIIPQPATAAASEIADQPQPVQKKKRGRRKRSEATPQPKRFSAIDELMDSTDWFDSTPPHVRKSPTRTTTTSATRLPEEDTTCRRRQAAVALVRDCLKFISLCF